MKCLVQGTIGIQIAKKFSVDLLFHSAFVFFFFFLSRMKRKNKEMVKIVVQKTWFIPVISYRQLFICFLTEVLLGVSEAKIFSSSCQLRITIA